MATEKDYTATISMRLPVSMIKEFDCMCKNSPLRMDNVEKVFRDRTDCIVTLAGIGLFIEKNKTTMKDPKFVEQLNQMIKDEKYMDWLAQLSPTQKKALRDLINQSLEHQEPLIR